MILILVLLLTMRSISMIRARLYSSWLCCVYTLGYGFLMVRMVSLINVCVCVCVCLCVFVVCLGLILVMAHLLIRIVVPSSWQCYYMGVLITLCVLRSRMATVMLGSLICWSCYDDDWHSSFARDHPPNTHYYARDHPNWWFLTGIHNKYNFTVKMHFSSDSWR